ncbi:phosphoglycerate mutase family protein [Enterococcus sp. BWT-B8]|uniref:histidine phosphatase family protein n=1 Tax=Enterococcus sp. BWT-B8 TaxID=2885157 RepID=UPI002A166B64|nr:histidine phosphatase family protein [Enterococcus sp. BWT-B8]MCB5950929.1 phosphoglycerate mutase family protein [Enterococcus sp. BWT-B8]
MEAAGQLGKGLEKENIQFASAYSSDSGSARETTEVLLNNDGQNDLNYTEDKRLREICFGTYEHDTNNNMWEAAANYKNTEKVLVDEEFTLEGMYEAI